MRIGGEDLDEALIQHVRNGHSLLIEAQQAEELKLATGSTSTLEQASPIHEIKGRNLITGLPKTRGVSLRGQVLHCNISACHRFANAGMQDLTRAPTSRYPGNDWRSWTRLPSGSFKVAIRTMP